MGRAAKPLLIWAALATLLAGCGSPGSLCGDLDDCRGSKVHSEIVGDQPGPDLVRREEPQCSSGEWKCEDDVVWECAKHSRKWLPVQQCKSTEACFNDACCQPDCKYRECDFDGCGGLCGQCEASAMCVTGICLAPADECDDGNEQAWDGCTLGNLTEFQVNGPDAPCGQRPSVTAIGDGGFAVAWELGHPEW